jgi:Ulp1 family protease
MEYKVVIYPANILDSHWILLIVDFSQCKIGVLDSYYKGSNDYDKLVQPITLFLQDFLRYYPRKIEGY